MGCRGTNLIILTLSQRDFQGLSYRDPQGPGELSQAETAGPWAPANLREASDGQALGHGPAPLSLTWDMGLPGSLSCLGHGPAPLSSGTWAGPALSHLGHGPALLTLSPGTRVRLLSLARALLSHQWIHSEVGRTPAVTTVPSGLAGASALSTAVISEGGLIRAVQPLPVGSLCQCQPLSLPGACPAALSPLLVLRLVLCPGREGGNHSQTRTRALQPEGDQGPSPGAEFGLHVEAHGRNHRRD